MKYVSFILAVTILFLGCFNQDSSSVYVDAYPDIYPDYKNICIPVNIAPLNFMMEDECSEINVELKGKNGIIKESGSSKIAFSLRDFKKLLCNHKNDTIWVSVEAKNKKGWIKYKPFFWKIIEDEIDNYLTYRLIEPGYEVWNKISLAERNISNFDERYIADNNLTNGSCMNCHIGNKYKPGKSFFHIRGEKGMTVIADGKNLRKLDTKPEGAYSNMIYGNWHPSGKYIAFSNNKVFPSTHLYKNKRAFVYDTISDVVVLDLENNIVLRDSLLSKEDRFETFPEFSADGEKLFFCSAVKVELTKEFKNLKYSLCSIDFDPDLKKFGDKTDTLFNANMLNETVSEPKASPNGKYLLFTCFSYGTFPIWHEDAKIYNLHLQTGVIDTLPELNNNKRYSNSYHSWSSNSKWVVFASKRDNGLYGKPYFSYIDEKGKAHKPFVLPQVDPEYYYFTYKSYNIPELFEQQRAFDANDIEKLFNSQQPIETVQYEKK